MKSFKALLINLEFCFKFEENGVCWSVFDPYVNGREGTPQGSISVTEKCHKNVNKNAEFIIIMCCTSLRGAAFFGASVHVAVGFGLFSRYVIGTVFITFYNFNDFFSERVSAFLAPFMVYVTLLFGLGILIFHSVEKEYFFLLKWSSVAFSLLQLAVFVTILLLKVSPTYHYHQFPFLPDSLTNGHFNNKWGPPHHTPSSESPAGPGSSTSGGSYITVPHGTTIAEKDILLKSHNNFNSKSSSDPPDPGGGNIKSKPNKQESASGYSKEYRSALKKELLRLAILIGCVVATLVYLVSLFLYIRQLNYEDTGHVFGHAQAITRNIAFYVQPQFASGQGQGSSQQQQTNNDNNKLAIGAPQVQRSQTQIPSQFLPQKQQQQQQNHLVSTVNTGHQQQQMSQNTNQAMQQQQIHYQQQQQNAHNNNVSTLGHSEHHLSEVQRSPARQQRVQQQQNLAPSDLRQQGQSHPGSISNNPGSDLNQPHHHQQGISSNVPQSHITEPGILMTRGHPSEGPSRIQGQFGPRGPIPAQVRIGFYAPGVTNTEPVGGHLAPMTRAPLRGAPPLHNVIGPQGGNFGPQTGNFGPQQQTGNFGPQPGNFGPQQQQGNFGPQATGPHSSLQQQQIMTPSMEHSGGDSSHVGGNYLICAPGSVQGPRMQSQTLPLPHQFQRLQFRKGGVGAGGQSSLTSEIQSDSASSSLAYSPNPLPILQQQQLRGKQQYNISMV